MVCCILALVRTSLQIDSVKHGNGRHRWYLSKADYEHVNFLTWMTQIFLFTNIGLLKCSICLLILRIKNEKVLRRCLYAMMVGLVLTNVEPIVVLLAQCRPIQKSWRTLPYGRCWPTQVRIYSIYVQVGT
jgi:ABC-type nickel/cobalt efflux system permease component RcnA